MARVLSTVAREKPELFARLPEDSVAEEAQGV